LTEGESCVIIIKLILACILYRRNPEGGAKIMAKINESYEAMVIFSSKLDEEGVKALTEKFNALIEANATDVELSNWGKRKLAYAINYETEGTYVLWTFTSKTDFPAELERILKITDGVIRFLVTVK